MYPFQGYILFQQLRSNSSATSSISANFNYLRSDRVMLYVLCKLEPQLLNCGSVEIIFDEKP